MRQLRNELMTKVQHSAGGAGTHTARRTTVRQLLAFFEQENICPNRVDDIRPRMIMRWVAAMRADGLSAGTIKNRLAHLRTLAPRALRGHDRNATVGAPKRSRAGTRRSITPAEFQERYERLDDSGVRAAVLLQSEFGLRPREAIKAGRWVDLWIKQVLAGEPIHIAEGARGGAKGGRSRDVDPTRREHALAVLRFAQEVADANGGYLVVGKKKPGQKDALQSAYDKLSNATRRAGFVGEIPQYALRYSYAQNRRAVLCQKGYSERQAEIAIIQDLGHGSGRTDLIRRTYYRDGKSLPPAAPSKGEVRTG